MQRVRREGLIAISLAALLVAAVSTLGHSRLLRADDDNSFACVSATPMASVSDRDDCSQASAVATGTAVAAEPGNSGAAHDCPHGTADDPDTHGDCVSAAAQNLGATATATPAAAARAACTDRDDMHDRDDCLPTTAAATATATPNGAAGNSAAAHACPAGGDRDGHGDCVSEAAHAMGQGPLPVEQPTHPQTGAGSLPSSLTPPGQVVGAGRGNSGGEHGQGVSAAGQGTAGGGHNDGPQNGGDHSGGGHGH